MNAAYAGSFDCYTNGHHNIVRKASRLFDTLHIIIAANSEKNRTYSAEMMVEAIKAVLAREKITNCTVSICKSLVAEYCISKGIDYFIRGLRNNLDYNYEENVAEVNKLISPNMETIYFRSDTPVISSSMVKELHSYGRDISAYVPPEVWNCICAADKMPQS